MTRRILGPLGRVEGDLTLTLELQDGKVAAAEATSGLFRGFERILVGRQAMDALAIVPRICGICSVSQSVAAARALAQLYHVTPPANGERVTNLIHAVENVADHLSHFYLFFMPDFARDAYAGHSWHADIRARFKAVEGSAHAPMLAARATLMRFMGTLAGHWPHTMVIQPGGVSRTVSAAERVRLGQWLAAFRRFLEQHTYGVPLQEVAAWDSPAALADYASRQPQADLARFLLLADSLGLATLGRCDAPLIAGPAYLEGEGSSAWAPAGVWQQGKTDILDTALIREHSRHAWLVDYGPTHPFDDDTLPVPDKTDAYSWSKAPRLGGQPAQTGAIARALLRRDRLTTALVQAQGSTVYTRVLARVREMALLVLQMQGWLAAIELDAPFQTALPAHPLYARGEGLTEAARGMLGHWVTLDGSRIQRYQIIAPTTWNFSPRDSDGQPGPLEAALLGTVADDAQALAVQHIVRSFDPCQVCTVQ